MKALSTEAVVGWLRAECGLSEAECTALVDGGLDGKCLEDVNSESLREVGLRAFKARAVLRVMRSGPWPPA